MTEDKKNKTPNAFLTWKKRNPVTGTYSWDEEI